jgi:hypothetical protein
VKTNRVPNSLPVILCYHLHRREHFAKYDLSNERALFFICYCNRSLAILAKTTTLAAEVTEHKRADEHVRQSAHPLTELANYRRLLISDVERHGRTARAIPRQLKVTGTRSDRVFALVPAKPGKAGPQLRPPTDDSSCSTAPPPTDPGSGSAPAPPATVAGGFPAVCGGIVAMPSSPSGRLGVGARRVDYGSPCDHVIPNGELGPRSGGSNRAQRHL